MEDVRKSIAKSERQILRDITNINMGPRPKEAVPMRGGAATSDSEQEGGAAAAAMERPEAAPLYLSGDVVSGSFHPHLDLRRLSIAEARPPSDGAADAALPETLGSEVCIYEDDPDGDACRSPPPAQMQRDALEPLRDIWSPSTISFLSGGRPEPAGRRRPAGSRRGVVERPQEHPHYAPIAFVVHPDAVRGVWMRRNRAVLQANGLPDHFSTLHEGAFAARWP